MLEIILEGVTLDLPPDIQINLTIENPFMSKDRIPVPFSLAFDLPPTPRNLKAFNYPNRINVELSRPNYSATIRFQGLNIGHGVITLDNFDKTIKVNFRGAEITDNLTNKLYELQLQSYSLGPREPGDIDFDTGAGWQYRSLMLSAVTANNGKFALAPVRVAGEDWQEGVLRRKNIGFPDSSADTMYINFYNAVAKSWMFSDVDGSVHSSNYPFPFVHYLVDFIFGSSLDDNPFTEGDFAKLVLLTMYHPAWRSKGKFPIGSPYYGFQPDTRTTDGPFAPYHTYLETRLPDMTAKDFVKELAKMFGFTLVTVKGRFEFRKNADILAQPVKDDWSAKLIDRPGINTDKAKTLNYGYENDTIEELSLPNYAKVANYQSLIDYFIRPEEEDGYFVTLQVTQTGEVFDKIKEGDGFYYEKRTSGFGELKEGENTFDLTVAIKPLEMSLEKYWWVRVLELGQSKPPMRDWLVPVADQDRFERQKNANIMFYHGVKDTYTDGDTYPYLSPHQIDPFGNELGDLSLYWEGERGLISNFHEEYRSWIEKDKQRVSSTVLLRAIDFHQLDITHKFHIHGRNFFIEKIQVTLRKDRIDPALVDFIEA